MDRLRRIHQQMFDCRQLGSELLAEDVEWVNPPDAVEPGTRRGANGFNEAIASVFEAWEDARFDTEELRPSNVRGGWTSEAGGSPSALSCR